MVVEAKLSLREGEGHGCNSSTLIDVMQVLLLPGRVMKVTGHISSPGDPSLSIVVLTEEVSERVDDFAIDLKAENVRLRFVVVSCFDKRYFYLLYPAGQWR